MKFLLVGLFLLLAPQAFTQNAAAPSAEMQKWIATLDTTWQETYTKEVTGPFDAEIAKLGQQYLAAMDAAAQKASTSGDLDQTVLWRAERERFALTKEVPAEDEANTPAPLKQLRTSWRTQSARLQKDRATRSAAVLARYDGVLAQAQKQLTQAQRIDEALLLKKQREDVAARWAAAAPAPAVAVASVEPVKPPAAPLGTKPAAAPASTGPAPKTPKLAPREVMERLLAAGVTIKIGEYRSQKEIRQVAEAPDKFVFYSLGFHPRKDGVPVTDEDVALLENVPMLAALTLEGIDVTDAGLEHLRGLVRLQYLEFNNLARVTGPGAKVLADLPALEYIRLLSMPTVEGVIKTVATGKRPAQIILGSMPIPEAALAALGTSSAMSRIDFEKETTGLTAAGLAHLVKMKKLAQLNFVDVTIDDAMAAEISKMDGLQHLTIRQSKLTEAGIVSLGRLRNLTDVTITSPPVTPAALATYKKWRALKNLTVGKVTPPEDMVKLRAALKGVTVKE